MNAALSFSHAFGALSEAPPAWQPLLRSVLLRAMQDAELQRLLGERSLWPELWAVGALLLGPAKTHSAATSRRARISLVPTAPLPAPSTEFSVLLESARRLEAPERDLDEPLLTRLLTLALADASFVQHLRSGNAADDFAADSQVRARRRSARR